MIYDFKHSHSFKEMSQFMCPICKKIMLPKHSSKFQTPVLFCKSKNHITEIKFSVKKHYLLFIHIEQFPYEIQFRCSSIERQGATLCYCNVYSLNHPDRWQDPPNTFPIHIGSSLSDEEIRSFLKSIPKLMLLQ